MFKRFFSWIRSLFSSKPVEPAVTFAFTGFQADAEDARDIVFSADSLSKGRAKPTATTTTQEPVTARAPVLPSSVDLASRLGPVEQQGNTNACVAHAVTTALEGVLSAPDHSRLFVYWNARAMAGQTTRDAGCTPRNAMKGISAYGSALEAAYPYDTSKILSAPPASVFAAALAIRPSIASYQSIISLDALKLALSNGQPVAFGMQIPDTFVTVTKVTGIQPMWDSSTQWIGAHAMVAVGYDDGTRFVKVRNSFGPNWGQAGFCFIPYDWFFTTNSKISDAWTFVKA